jgi:hypothetical protein
LKGVAGVYPGVIREIRSPDRQSTCHLTEFQSCQTELELVDTVSFDNSTVNKNEKTKRVLEQVKKVKEAGPANEKISCA